MRDDPLANFARTGEGTDSSAPIGRDVLLGGRYRVGDAIGRGGTAMVYRGYDELLHRDVAVKALGPMAANAVGSRQEFLREARAAAALSHPNIVGVFDAGVQGGERYIVMEFVAGGSLFDLIQADAPLPVGRAVRIATQLADALDEGHRHGIIHCDVKPQNVLLDESGRPKLVDFGISRSIAATGALTDTITGTAGYIAPEQLVGDRLDGRADIYALGCLTYEMLTGELPFESSSLAALAAQRLVRAPVPLRRRNPHVPPALAETVMRALEREPAARYQTAHEFSTALESDGGDAPALNPPPRLQTRSAEIPRRRQVTTVIDRPPPPRAPAEEGPRLFWPITLVVLGILIFAGALAAIELPSLIRPSGSPIVAVPDLSNQGLDDAASQLHAQGLNVTPILQNTTLTGPCTGRVLRQSPTPPAQLQAGSVVTVTVSRSDRC